MYTCPMHSEIQKEKPGRCPKCAMLLVRKEEVTQHAMVHESDEKGLGKQTWKSYMPLMVIIGVILLR